MCERVRWRQVKTKKLLALCLLGHLKDRWQIPFVLSCFIPYLNSFWCFWALLLRILFTVSACFNLIFFLQAHGPQRNVNWRAFELLMFSIIFLQNNNRKCHKELPSCEFFVSTHLLFPDEFGGELLWSSWSHQNVFPSNNHAKDAEQREVCLIFCAKINSVEEQLCSKRFICVFPEFPHVLENVESCGFEHVVCH